MRYGLELPCGGDHLTVDLLLDLAVAAERSGWDGVFLEDYLVYYRGDDPPTFDPWVVLAAAAGRTTRVVLGTTVSGLLARDPVKLAREAVTLDALAPGRVVLGVGVGDPADRGTQVGVQDTRRARGREMDRRLDLLLALLHGQPVDGPTDGPVVFRPTAHRVRVWVGGSAEAKAVARRGARADGVVPYKVTDTRAWSDFTSTETAQLVAAVAEHRGSSDGLDVAVGGRRRLTSLTAERAAVEAARDGGATWWLEFLPPATPSQMLDTVRAGPVRAA
ncbi:LLM class flavin-dependent oxidoreductase [Lapillicoccus jejuensis]|uniref:Luciferase-like monooxygenase n=1 Tax=Lapillicoccus jejuensis TaxID=402171 RepID=A0A542E6E4_9MICO|nr:LLM class flavin-dependent oxidoreductase [Lapillicoccus jejuensis]TQJ10897.1 luciferase-like monooxygenase [Lapillicoccus jejuensis]